MTTHLEVWEQENASLHACDDWLSWVQTVQEIVGFDDDEIDGDRSVDNPHPDPTCIDELSDWHSNGYSAACAAEIIIARIMEGTT